MKSQGRETAPTLEEIVAAVAAVRVILRRQGNSATQRGDRWSRTARAEGVAPAMTPGPAHWATLERPR